MVTVPAVRAAAARAGRGLLLAASCLAAATFTPFFGVTAHVVLSGSMGGALPAGSVAAFRRAPAVAPGDVIVFAAPEQGRPKVAHRVVRTVGSDRNSFLATKGDANTDGDPWLISRDAVEGKLLFFIPAVGRPLAAVRTPLGFAALAGLGGVLAAWELARLLAPERKLETAR